MTRQQHLLVVEDDVSIQSLMSAFLEKENFRVSTASDAAEAQSLLNKMSFDMVLIDLGLPDEDGLVIARKLKARSDIPIVFVTQRDDDDSKLAGLEMGGDDYITKPFNPKELVARIRNILRRKGGDGDGSAPRSQVFSLGDWRIDLDRRQLFGSTGEVTLTRAEFDLLAALVLANGRVLSRDFLIDAVSSHSEDVSDRTVDVLVSRIRKKMGDDQKHSRIIVTIPTLGYRLGVSATEADI
jgi:two-component system, OmpR family, torCAD operon response regulator TorR